MLLTLCLLACSPTDPLQAFRPSATDQQQPVTNLPGCGTVVVAVSGSSGASATFPADSACRTGLVLISGGTATYTRAGGGRFTLPVRIVNRSGAAVMSPVRLELAVDSSVVLAPPGLAKNGKKGVTPAAPDSSLAAGAVWLVGTGPMLGAGDTTSPRDLVFDWDNGVHSAGFHFTSTAAPALVDIPALPAESLTGDVVAHYYADSNLIKDDSLSGGPFPRGIIIVSFMPGTSVDQKRQAIGAIGGQVVGGLRGADTGPIAETGYYYVAMPGTPSAAAMRQALATVKAFPFVGLAMFDYLVVSRHSLKPKDGLGWTHWNLDGQPGPGLNWGLEVIRAPLAWGCDVGNESTTVAIVDVGFYGASDIIGNIDPHSTGEFNQNRREQHGLGVSSVAAARGNNEGGMTGVMWKARLRLYDYSKLGTNANSTLAITTAIQSAALAGATVINVSSGFGWQKQVGHLPSASSQKDLAMRNALHQVMLSTLTNLKAAGFSPLVVFSAGNDGIDASWTGFPMVVADPVGDHVLVVGATDRSSTLPSWSDRGPLVEVAAPGEEVGMLDSTDAVISESGTSFAAPFVSGVAGLLLGTDTSLTGADLKSFIVAGATSTHRAASGIPLVDAYAALELHAQRLHVPLCGNHLWLNGDSLIARRGTTTEVLASGLGIRDIDATYHGGRRIDVFSTSDVGSLTYQASRWSPSPRGPYDSLAISGASWSAQGFSHDDDSSAVIRQIAPNPAPVAAVLLTDLHSGQTTQLTTFNAWFPNYTGNPSNLTSEAGYSSITNTLIVPVRPTAADPSVSFYSVAIPGGQSHLLWSIPNAHNVQVGVSEDGQEAIVNYTGLSATLDPVCKIEYRLIGTGQVLDQGETQPDGSGSCRGAIAPAPRFLARGEMHLEISPASGSER